MGAGALDSHPMPRQTSYEAEPQGFRNRRWVFDIMTNSPANRDVARAMLGGSRSTATQAAAPIPATFTNPSSDALRHGFRDRLSGRRSPTPTVCTGPAAASRREQPRGRLALERCLRTTSAHGRRDRLSSNAVRRAQRAAGGGADD